MNKKNLLNGLLIAIISLGVGFIAMLLPFKLFDELTSNQATILFIIEIVIYGGIGLGFISAKQINADKKQKAKRNNELRKSKIQKLQTDWYDLVA